MVRGISEETRLEIAQRSRAFSAGARFGRLIDNSLSERTLRAIAVGRNNWGVPGSESGGKTAAVLYSAVGTCKHLRIDSFLYLRAALPGLFTLGKKPSVKQLLGWLPGRWLLQRSRVSPAEQPAAAG